jgi:ribonuclease HI
MTTALKERNEQTRISSSSRWILPPPCTAKINVDAAILENGGIGSVAAVARVSTGTFLGASTLVVEGISDPEVMEAIACREGVLATDLFLQKVKMASDCNNVVKSFMEEALS